MPEKSIKSYAGFTIGPIHDVMRHSKKTRELWFGSYFFSWYMERLTAELIAGGNGITFLTPYVKEPYEPNCSLGGKFHDRFVAQSSSLSPEEFHQKIKEANRQTLKYFSKLICDLKKQEEKKAGHSSLDAETVYDILKGYIQTRFFTIDAEKIEQKIKQADEQGKKTVVRVVDEYLNAMEDNFIFTPGKSVNTCSRCKTLPGIIKVKEKENDEDKQLILCPLCFVKLRAHHIKEELLTKRLKTHLTPGGELSYPATNEIAARDIFQKDEVKINLGDKKSEDISYEELAQIFKAPIKPVYKYFAIVQADGDNLGRLAAGMDDVTELSKRLFSFTDDAEEAIADYGGVPIYLGGDDILAFLPVFFGESSILDFIEIISGYYKEDVDNNADSTTISFGLNLVYYKFPLAAALDKATSLLFNTAKLITEKNSLAVSLTKHSGSETSFNIKLNDPAFALIRDMVNDLLNKKIKIPRGTTYNLARSKTLLAQLPDDNRLTAFFENNFNEGRHQNEFNKGLEKVEDLFAKYLFGSTKTCRTKKESVAEALNILKFIRFLTGEEI